MSHFLPTDISRCRGDGCPKKESCLRYLAESKSVYQSYIDTGYIDGKCTLYIDAEKKRYLVDLERELTYEG